MTRLQDNFPRTSTWGDLSDKLVRHFGLPNGSKFALRRKGKAGAKRPYVRVDATVRRKLFKKNDHPRGERVRVSEICREIEALLAPPYRSNVVALGPDGEPLDGNTHLGTWKGLRGRITEAERDVEETRRRLVEHLRRMFLRELADSEEAVEDPHVNVTEAVLWALVDYYGAEAVKDAIEQLRLYPSHARARSRAA